MISVRRAAVLVSFALCPEGCGTSTGAISQTASTPVPTYPMETRFRMVNGSPGTGNVDVYLYQQGSIRPPSPTFSNVPFGTITPFAAQPAGLINMDVLRAGAVSTSVAILSQSDVTQQVLPPVANSLNYSLVIEGTALSNTRMVEVFLEPAEQQGTSALVVHNASPAANLLTQAGPIGVGIYSATHYPPLTSSSAIALADTQQLFTFSYVAGGQTVPLPNTSVGGYIFLTPFPVPPLPAAVGFAVGLPSASTVANAPLKSVIANAALSETANANSPYGNQNAITNDIAETFSAGQHISEFLIDADQNGSIGLIGTVDP